MRRIILVCYKFLSSYFHHEESLLPHSNYCSVYVRWNARLTIAPCNCNVINPCTLNFIHIISNNGTLRRNITHLILSTHTHVLHATTCAYGRKKITTITIISRMISMVYTLYAKLLANNNTPA